MAHDADDRLARIEALLEQQQRQIDELRAENHRLRTRAARPAPLAPEPLAPIAVAPDPDAPPSSAIGRRRLLIGGATAGAAAVAAVVASPIPAAAGNGNPLVLGAPNNEATATTGLSSTLASDPTKAAFKVTSTGDGRAIEGVSGPGAFAIGVAGFSTTGTGVYGRSDVTGVWGQSANEYGVYGASDNSIGVYGAGTSDAGVFGQSASASGVVGISTSNAGVFGQSTSGPGMFAVSSAGPGLQASGALANLRLTSSVTRTAPTTDTVAHVVGDIVTDAAGNLWVCVAAGTPGSWRKLAGPATSGTLHLLPAPVRIYDSRADSTPSQGPKTPFAPNSTRVFDCKVNGSGVPAGAAGALITVLLVNAFAGSGNMSVWANGVARPASNTMVWGGSAGRFTGSATTALDASARIQVHCSARTDLVLDVVGYYR
jgi:hypothetical protein